MYFKKKEVISLPKMPELMHLKTAEDSKTTRVKFLAPDACRFLFLSCVELEGGYFFGGGRKTLKKKYLLKLAILEGELA